MTECVSLSAKYTLAMDSLVILLLIVLIVLVIVLFKRLESKIDDLSVQSEIIKMRLTKMDGVGSVPTAAKKTPLPPPPPPFVPSPSHFTPLPSVKTPPPVPEKKHEPEKEKASKRNFEKLVGENLFSKIGILVFVIGIGFFVKFAVDNNWINEIWRTVLGFVTGAVLWAIAYKIRENYRNFSSVLAGGGFAVWFVTGAVAYNFYHLFPSGVAFAILIGITALMIFITLYFNRRELGSVAVVGGFIAPFLIVSDNVSYVALFSYITVLNLAMLVISLRRRWWELSIISCFATWITVAVFTITTTLDVTVSGVMIAYSIAYLVLFSIPLTFVMDRKSIPALLFGGLLGAVIVNGFAFLIFSMIFVGYIPWFDQFKGIFPLLAATVHAILFFRFYRKAADIVLQQLLLWLVVIFATLFLPIQFSQPSIVAVCLSAYMLVLTVSYDTTGKRMFGIAALVMGVGNVLYLFGSMTLPSDFSDGITAFPQAWSFGLCGLAFLAVARLNGYKFGCQWLATLMAGISFYAFVGSVFGPSGALSAFAFASLIVMLGMARFIAGNGFSQRLLPAVAVLTFVFFNTLGASVTSIAELLRWGGAAVCATLLVILFPKYFKTGAGKGSMIYYSLSASVFLIACIELGLRSTDLTRFYSAGISVGFTLCGAMLMFVGMRFNAKTVRLLSLCMFGCVILKLVVYDLWRLPVVGRIIVFIFLGLVLLAVSFFYQRLRRSLSESSKPADGQDENAVE